MPAVQGVFQDADSAPQGAIAVEMRLAPSPAFTPKEISAPAGSVALFLSNPRITDARNSKHNVHIGPKLLDSLVSSPDVLVGSSGVFTVTGLEPGQYVFWCTVDLHYQGGMRGVLTVTP